MAPDTTSIDFEHCSLSVNSCTSENQRFKTYSHNKNALGAFVDNLKKNLRLSKISLDTFDGIKMSQNFFN